METSELDRRFRTTPATSASAEGVTLCCVDCVHPDVAAAALAYSSNGCEFDRVLLLSDEPPKVFRAGIDWQHIRALSFPQYQRFVLRELASYIDTPHVLTIEADGFILRPERWNPDWLQWDYIGAPWPKSAPYARRTRVGNSGCCLRSRRLLEKTASLATYERIARHGGLHLLVDVFTCCDLYDDLTAAGLKFAPPEVAAAFAFEQPTEFSRDDSDVFGYHGKFQAATGWLQNETPLWLARTKWRQAGGRLRVIWNRYEAATQKRQAELDTCLAELRSNPHVDDVISIDGRPTFQYTFSGIQPGPDDVTVILNSDCHLDYTAADFALCGPSDFWCLTRNEQTVDGWSLWDVPYSQDAWAWRGKCRLTGCDFLPGTPGCDSSLAYRAMTAGYQVANPSRSIRVCHRHAGPERSGGKRMRGPYLEVNPHRLGEPPAWRINVAPRAPKAAAVWTPRKVREFSDDWVSVHADNWMRWLDPWRGKAGVQALEIGSHEGHSACWFCERILTGEGSRLTCVDPWLGTEADFYPRFLRNVDGLPVDVIRATSADALPIKIALCKQFAWAYIDGSHHAPDLMLDLVLTWELLKPGGVLIVDDYDWTEPVGVPIPPKPAVDAFLSLFSRRIARHEISRTAAPQVAIWKPA